ncbi:hypothetical protein [Leifsonia xyli]|uniref:hypothetical protein n=1 Tax=Leifsonia xyli TaxID=1575 RepID=UPI003D6645DC
MHQRYGLHGPARGFADFFSQPPLSWRGPQLALLSLVPIGGVLLLFLVSRRARARYEAAIFDAADRMGGRGVQRTGKLRPLASEGFWRTARVGSPTERLHLAAAFLLVALLLAWDRMFAGTAACAKLQTFVSPECLVAAAQRGDLPILIGGVAAAAGLVAAIVCVGVLAETTNPGGGPVNEYLRDRLRRTGTVTAWILVGGVVIYVFVGASLWFGGQYEVPGTGAFLGLATAPSIILGVLVAICISALGWRRGVPHWLSIALMTVAGLTFLAGVAQNPATVGGHPGPLRVPLFAVAALLTAAQLVLVWWWPRSPSGRRAGPPERFRAEGWAGMGPGILMLLSLGAAMILSTLLVLGVQGWLVSGSTPCGCVTAGPHHVLRPPIVYHNFGDVLPFVALALALIAAGIALSLLRWMPRLTTPRTLGGRRPLLEQVDAYRDGRIDASTTADRLALKILRARRLAALVHRGEPILGILAGLLAVGFVIALAVSYTVPFRAVDALVGPALTVIAAAILAVIVENALTAKERPISVMWDLMCFLPRAGHPFGPPCYAERVVPELRDRVTDWLTHDLTPPEGLDLAEQLHWRDQQQDDALTRERPFSVVLSAHSLGAVLAVSTLFTLRPGDAERLHNVGLLTYGAQLRVYFGRFFPELFGPDALGTLGSRRPLLGKGDPVVHAGRTRPGRRAGDRHPVGRRRPVARAAADPARRVRRLDQPVAAHRLPRLPDQQLPPRRPPPRRPRPRRRRIRTAALPRQGGDASGLPVGAAIPAGAAGCDRAARGGAREAGRLSPPKLPPAPPVLNPLESGRGEGVSWRYDRSTRTGAGHRQRPHQRARR